MRKQLLFALAISITTQLAAQQPFKKTTLYGEIGGNGLGILSVNYERQIGTKPGLGLFVGISPLSGNKPSIVSGAKYLIKLHNDKSFLETGLGISFADREYMGSKTNNYEYNPYTPVLIPSVGYRHHTKYGLLWRVNYTPVFSKYNSLLLYPGISVGWRL